MRGSARKLNVGDAAQVERQMERRLDGREKKGTRGAWVKLLESDRVRRFAGKSWALVSWEMLFFLKKH